MSAVLSGEHVAAGGPALRSCCRGFVAWVREHGCLQVVVLGRIDTPKAQYFGGEEKQGTTLLLMAKQHSNVIKR